MIIIDTDKMQLARRLNGGLIDGYAGYFTKYALNGNTGVIIVIPHKSEAVDRLMREIDSEE